MVTDLHASIRASDIADEIGLALRELLAVMFDLKLDEDAPEDAVPDNTAFNVRLPITGAHDLYLYLCCPSSLAAAASAAALGVPEQETTAHDRLDAAREIANVVGGRLQGVFFQNCEIGLPQPASTALPVAVDAICGRFDATFRRDELQILLTDAEYQSASELRQLRS